MAEHSSDELLGMNSSDAESWAGAVGWAYRVVSDGGWHTDDLRTNRINVWFDENERVCRAEIY